MGVDEGTPVTEGYKKGNNKFTGKIQRVTIDLKDVQSANTEPEQHAVRDVHARKTMTD